MEKSGRLKALKICGSDTASSKKHAVQAVNKQGPVAQLVSAPPCHGGGRGFKSRQGRSDCRKKFPAVKVTRHLGSVAQLVERSTENRKVTGSTPVGATS